MRKWSRRQVLALGSLGVGGALIGGVVATTQGAALPAGLQPGRPLPPLSPLSMSRDAAGVLSATLVASRTPTSIAGIPVRTLTYNGLLPGPVLRVREGDHVRLRFQNGLDQASNLHLHGLHLSPAVDAPFTHLMPGETHVYEFTAPTGSAGTYWYHPHPHGEVASQLFAGLAGALIVEGGVNDHLDVQAAEEHVLVLKDFALQRGQVSAHSLLDLNGKEGPLVTVNGAWRPVLTARKRTLRLRLLNASTTHYYRLQLADHPLHLIATDGGFIEQPVALEQLLLAPGERAEVMVQLRSGGPFTLTDLGYSREGGDSMASPLMTIQPLTSGPLTALPARLTKVERLDLTGAVVRPVTLNQNFPMSFGMNGQAFDMNRVNIQARQGTTEIWELVSRSDSDHPFHLHSYPLQVLSRNGRPEPFRAWRDVVNVRGGETVRVAVPFRNFSGTTVYHCHIAEHEDHGMMGVLQVQPPSG